ncbi:hypothetical protein C8F01DRAFT_1119270 [Mycena amicta]|nr:hypothetical protein C8F01DRAFT_1119270 [Mycena amicta]
MALPGFKRVEPTNRYGIIHGLLWPTSQETDRLAPYIETCQADLSWWTADRDGDATPVDVEKSDQSSNVDNSNQPPPALTTPIRYLDLRKHPSFAMFLLHDLNKMILRQEYDAFMSDSMQEGENRRFFLTGQPGIGKSVGAGYLLFSLLASGRPVFFIPDAKHVYYFSEAGADEVGTDLDMNDMRLRGAIQRSWVLVDMDTTLEWYPPPWTKAATRLVWTSLPNATRKHHYESQFNAKLWYMKPWSLMEIAALTTLEERDPQKVWARLKTHGPVARSLFATDTDKDMIKEAMDIDRQINLLLASNIFSFASPDKASDHIFLIQPQETLDAAGQLVIHRTLSSVNFLSNPIASRTVELLQQQHLERFWQQIAFAFDISYTRFIAGKLIESLLHRLLIERKIDLPIAFSGGKVAEQLELIGKADNFFLETHTQDRRHCRPLYLRPQSPNCNFAAVDAILITEANLYLFQTSLSDTHSHDFNMPLRTLARLATLKIEVDSLQPFYCVVGMKEDRVKKLLVQATRTLALLQRDPKKVPELENLSQKDLQRLGKMKAMGCTFDVLTGCLQEVELEAPENVDVGQQVAKKRRLYCR